MFIKIKTLYWQKYPERCWIENDAEMILRSDQIVSIKPWDDGAWRINLVDGDHEAISAHEYKRIELLLTGEQTSAPALPADVISDQYPRTETFHFSYDAGFEDGPEWGTFTLPNEIASTVRRLRDEESGRYTYANPEKTKTELISMLYALVPETKEIDNE